MCIEPFGSVVRVTDSQSCVGKTCGFNSTQMSVLRTLSIALSRVCSKGKSA